MRSSNVIRAAFWDELNLVKASSPAKLILIYLFTNRLVNAIGFYRIEVWQIGGELGITLDLVEEALKELEKKKLIGWCDLTSYILMYSFFRHNPIQNRKMAKNCEALIEDIPAKCRLFPNFLKLLKGQLNKFSEDFCKKFYGEGEPVTHGEQHSDKSDIRRATRLPEDWEPSPEYIEIAQSLGLADPWDTAQRFKDHFCSSSKQNATKLDWKRTWRNWCKATHDRQERAGSYRPFRRFKKKNSSLYSAIIDEGFEDGLQPRPDDIRGQTDIPEGLFKNDLFG